MMEKKKYISPAMQVYKIQRTQLLCGSAATRGLGDGPFSWDDDGLDDEIDR